MQIAAKEKAENRKHSAVKVLKLMIRDQSAIASNKIKRTELGWNGNLRRGLRKFHKYCINIDIDSPAVTVLYNLSMISFGRGIRKLTPINAAKGENSFLQEIISPIYSIPYKEHLGSLNPSNSLPLDYYIINGGNCIAKSLMAIAVLQRYREEGKIDGVFGIRYSFDKNSNYGHAWVSYRDSKGTMIVDPTHGLIIRLGDDETNKAIESFLIKSNGWNYFNREAANSSFIEKSLFTSFIGGYGLIGAFVMDVGAMGLVTATALAIQVVNTVKYLKNARRQVG